MKPIHTITIVILTYLSIVTANLNVGWGLDFGRRRGSNVNKKHPSEKKDSTTFVKSSHSLKHEVGNKKKTFLKKKPESKKEDHNECNDYRK